MTDHATSSPAAGGAGRTAADGEADALTVFSVLWALAAVWHLLASPSNATEGTQLVLALGVLAVLAVPGHPAALAVLAVGGLATMWSEAPRLGNHWLLAGFVHLAILGAVGLALARRRPGDRGAVARHLLPTIRASLLAFYAFAAFAKLNSAFFDRTVSCGTAYFRESTASVHAAFLQRGAAADWAAIYGTSAIELVIPVLLVWRRTRVVGVAVALVFHGVLAIDRAHLFFDFTSLLAPLFLLFLPASSATAALGPVRRLGEALARRGPRAPLAARVLAALVPAGAALVVATRRATTDVLGEVGWWSWQLAGLAVVVAVVAHLRRARPAAAAGALRIRPLLLAAVPALVVLNGLTPYLELKTGYGWNMYANLRTVDGDSNHFVVRATLPLTDQQADLVEVVRSSDAGLQTYADEGMALPWQSLRAYTATRPEASLVYRRGGRQVRVDRVGDVPELATSPPGWRLKVQPFRASDPTPPERCQTSFLPAG